MSEDTVAVTKDGLRLSYGRFLADSAGGYVLLIAVGYIIIVSNFDPAEFAAFANQTKPAAIILAGVFTLLLGPPFGLALNSASWFLLGCIEAKFLNLWARSRWFHGAINWLTYGTGEEYSIAALQRTFRFLDPKADGSRDLYSQIHLLQKLMHSRFAAMMGRVDYLNGIKIFIRNLSFLTLAVAFYLPLRTQDATIISEQRPITYALAATLVLTFLACLLELYRALEVAYSVYGICLLSDPENAQNMILSPEAMTFEACIERLLTATPARGDEA